VTVDTTVQPKAITFPTDAKLLHEAIKRLNRLGTRHGVRLRQSYLRIAKNAAMMASRYAHAKQFKRHQRQLRIPRSRSSATSAARSPDGRNSRWPLKGRLGATKRPQHHSCLDRRSTGMAERRDHVAEIRNYVGGGAADAASFSCTVP
jgi:hypothetical protein